MKKEEMLKRRATKTNSDLLMKKKDGKLFIFLERIVIILSIAAIGMIISFKI